MTRRDSSQTDLEFFEARVFKPETPCWNWRVNIGSSGYGKWTRSDRQAVAHRVAYELLVGPIPEGMQLHHKCFNRSCVNPEHLEPVTPKQNKAMSRGMGAVNKAKMTCVNGHPFDEANTYVTERGHRQCRACRKASVQKVAERKPTYGIRERQCKNGHPRTEENTEIRGGHRRCRLCRIEGKRKPGGYKDPNRTRPTYCPHGHELTPKNTYEYGDGRYYCRPCNRAAKART